MEKIKIHGDHHDLFIDPQDKLACKLAMLFEATGLGVNAAIEKYGYTEQRYYQLLKLFKEKGSQGLMDNLRGPKSKRVRTDQITGQVLRHRFLDPRASAAVIAQKMQQSGHKISVRSVERTITEYGLQKKTPFVRPPERGPNPSGPTDKTT
jgi:transposase